MVKVSQVVKPELPGFTQAVKAYVFLIALIGAGFFTSFFLEQGRLIPATVFFAAFLTLFILATVVIVDKRYLFGGVLLASAAFVVPFYTLAGSFFFVSSVALLAFFLSAAVRGRQEVQTSLRIRLLRISRMVVDGLLAGSVVFFTAMLILTSGFSVKRERVDQFIEVFVAPVVERLYNVKITPRTPIGEAISAAVMAKAAGDRNFESLPSAAKEQILRESVAEAEQRLEGFLGVAISSQTEVGQGVYDALQTKLSGLSPQAKVYWGIGLIFAVWLSVKAVEFLVYPPLALLVWLVYELLIAAGIVSVKLETRDKEVATLQ